MSAMTLVLSEMSGSSNSQTYAISGHSVSAPRLLIQKWKYASTPQATASDQVDIVYGAVDADGLPLASKVVFGAQVRRPANADSVTIAAALAAFRDFVASDEFAAMVNGQFRVK